MRRTFQMFKTFRPQIFSLLIGYKTIKNPYLNQDKIQTQQTNDNSQDQQTDENDKIKSQKNLNKHIICQSEDIQEGQFKSFTIENYRVIVGRVQGKIFCISGTCTYDDKTDLSNGILFGNKLYCPCHGCAFNVQTGSVEYAPAMDHLPIFYITEKENQVQLFFPKAPPSKIRPSFTSRDFSDMRKVVIVGSGVSAHAAIETIRSYGYSGEIIMISQETKLPYDYTQLTKSIKNLNYEEIKLRPDEWQFQNFRYDDMDVNYMLGRTLHSIYNKHGKPHIELDDNTRIEYDALLCATGVSEVVRNIPGISSKNMYFLRNTEDHKLLKTDLQDMKNFTILGCSLKSLELASTIKKEFPKLNLFVVDENDESNLYKELGEEVFQKIIYDHVDKGVKFLLRDKVKQFDVNEEEQITNIHFDDGINIPTDGIICFPNNFQANTDFLDRSEGLDDIEYDASGRVYTDTNCRSEHKRVFFTGKNSYMNYFFLDHRRIICHNYNQEYHQGVTAGLNILGLGIPFHQVVQGYTKQYDQNYLQLGAVPKWDEVFIDGDLKKNDFIAYYALNDYVIGAFASQNRSKQIAIYNEAFRLAFVPSLTQIKEKIVTIDQLEKNLKAQGRSGCFRDEIYKVRHDPIEQDVLWVMRGVTANFTDIFYKDQRPSEFREGQTDQ